MPTDEERREVARRLREAASYYESMERDVDFYQVESAIGLKPAGETAYTPESVRSLADLIDPDTTSEQTNHDESSLSASPIDCGVLLGLADDVEDSVKGVGVEGSLEWMFLDIAKSIREACVEGEK